MLSFLMFIAASARAVFFRAFFGRYSSVLCRAVIVALSSAASLFLAQPNQVQAATRSASCQAINADWSGGRSISTATAVPGRANNDYKEYYDLEPGETISWSVTASGTQGSNNYANYWVAEPLMGVWEDYDDTKTRGPFSRSGSRTLAEDETVVGLEVMVNYLSTELPPADVTMSVTCAASNAVAAPVAGNLSITVASNSEGNAVPLPLSGGAPDSIAVSSTSQHGELIISGTSIKYTPHSNFFGSDSFEYTATNAGGTSAPGKVSVTVTPPAPTISGMSPDRGTTVGGTSVTIIGTGLGSASAVSFGGNLAAISSYPNADAVTVTTPEGSAGASDVTVTTPGGSATRVGGFTYVAPISLSLSPAAGAISAGFVGFPYSQTFTATGGDGDYEYFLSGDHPPGMSLNRSNGTFSGTPQVSYDFRFTVLVRDGAGNEGRASYSFAVSQRTPSISSVAPSSGPSEGGTPVTINGANFTGATSVQFGSSMATSFVVESDNRIQATTPSHSAATVDVAVTGPGGSATASNAYTYKAVSADATLVDIWVGAGALTPSFSPQVTTYSVQVPADMTSIWMNAATADSNAWFIAGGAERKSGSSWRENLLPGDNPVQVVGLAEDRTTEKTYTVTITRGAAAAETTTNVVASPNPSVSGQNVSITATVAAVAPATGTPTGSVVFTGPGGLSETVTVDGSGKATFSSASMSSGTITATYNGGVGFNGSGGSVGLTVNPAATEIGVSASPNPGVSGQDVTVTAVVAPVAPGSGVPTGSVTFGAWPDLAETVSLDSTGKATITSDKLISGAVTAVYSGDTGFRATEGYVNLTVNSAATKTTVSATPNPSASGQEVAVTAIVTAVAPSTGIPSGSVTFTGPSGLSETVAVDGAGKATFTSTSLRSGTVTATYSGGSSFSGSAGSVSIAVSDAASQTLVSATPNPSVLGQNVTVTASVTTVAPATGTPIGSVTFTGPSGLSETIALDDNGSATFTSDSIADGTVTATYSGGSGIAGSSGTVTIAHSAAATQTVVSATPNPSVVGQSISVTATVTASAPATGTPAGSITFTGSNGLSEVVALDGSGKATYTSKDLTTGTITAAYSGETGFLTSTGSVAITVGAAATQTALTADPNSSVVGEKVVLTATVSAIAPATGVPAGSVTFVGPNGLNETVALTASGKASLSSTTLSSGSVKATYNGNSLFLSSEATTAISVGAAESKTVVAASPSTSVVGQSVSITATVAAVAPATGTPTGSVTFTGMNGLNETVAVDSNGEASFSSTSLSSGTVTATYSGSAEFSGSAGSTSLTVGAAATETTVYAMPDTSTVGQDVTVTASVATVAPATGIPTGTITFTGPNGINETVSLDASGKAAYSFAALSSGTIKASYIGSPAFSGSAATVAIKVDVAAAELTISATPNPSIVGENVELAATVSPEAPASGTPTGSVIFRGPNGFNETVALDPSGKATVASTELVSGSYTATYSGSSAFSGASGNLTISVGAAGTETAVSATPNPSVVGESVSVTAIVAPIQPATGVPTGSVTFTGPGGLNQTVILDASGKATFSSAALVSGTLKASYGGSAAYSSSVGTSSVTVGAASTETTVSATPNPGKAGENVKLEAVVAVVAPATGVPTGSVVFKGPNGFSASAELNASGVATVSTNKLSSGTVTATYSGNSLFGASASDIAIDIEVAAKFVFSPAGGALAEAMAGEEYSQSISAKGGKGALLYSVVSGELPKGMILNISTGDLSGPSAADAEGDYSFAIQVRDADGNTASETFSLKVLPREVTVTDKVINVAAGETPSNVYLNRGATGGPFSSAELTSVEPSNAGTASIIQGELAQAGSVTRPIGWYLQFTPNPAFSGQVRVGFRLTSSLGASNTGTVAYNLGYDAAQIEQDIAALVHGFVQTRQNLISSAIKVPGLMERRQMATSGEAVITRVTPSAEGLTLGFSTSLAQMEAARDAADGIGDTALSPFNIWMDGTFMAHNREENGNNWGNFAALSVGADYLLTDKALIGVSLHYDHMTDPTDEDAELRGNGWLAGPNASFEIGKGVFWDTSILYGGSANDIDTLFWDGSFDTRRWFFDTAINGRWELDDVTVVTPELRGVYFSEDVEDYAVTNDIGDEVKLDGFNEEQLRLSLGAEIARQFTLENDTTVTPKLGWTIGYSGMDGDGIFGSVSAAVSVITIGGWNTEAGLLFNIEGDGQVATGAKVGVSRQF